MATVSKAIADQIIAGDGYYSDDPRATRVIRYTNFEGVHAYAIEWTKETRYQPSEFVRNPEVIWRAK